MNTLYLLGNGFDINLGMETSYTSFYDYLEETKSSSVLMEKMKTDINNDRDNWSDFEISFGEYTESLKDESEFVELHKELVNDMSNYLWGIDSQFRGEDVNVSKLRRDLINPVECTRGNLKNELLQFVKAMGGYAHYNTITFNYTTTLGHLLTNSGGINNLGEGRKLDQIVHVHGDLIRRMIVGVNDVEQIKNEAFRNIPNIVNRIVKPSINEISNDDSASRCISLINNAHLIVLFGLSIGPTDKFWWRKIIERLIKGRCKILIMQFYKDEIDEKIPMERVLVEDKIKSKLLSYSEITDDDLIEVCKSNIHVVINGTFLQKLLPPEAD